MSMTRIKILALAIGVVPILAAGDQPTQQSTLSPVVEQATASTSVLVTTILSNADVAMIRSSISSNLLKGGFGEAHMNRYMMPYLRPAGAWQPISARLGVKGIDGLQIRFDSAGRPVGLIVTEAKYGSSRLGMTKDGIQMGESWIAKRLTQMGKHYRTIAGSIRSGTMQLAGPEGSVGKQRIEFRAENGKAYVFTRENARSAWKLVGKLSQLNEQAAMRAEVIGDHLSRAGVGDVAYERYIYRVKFEGNSMRITIKDAMNLDALGSEARLPTLHKHSITLSTGTVRNLGIIAEGELAKLIQASNPRLTAREVQDYARLIRTNPKSLEEVLENQGYWTTGRTIAFNSAVAGGVAAVLDVGVQVASQLLNGEPLDLGRIGRSAGVSAVAGATGAAAGQELVNLMVRNPNLYLARFSTRVASSLGIGSSRFANQLLGGAAGGGIASVIMAYGSYLAGLCDLETAHRSAVAGVAGTIGGAVTGGAIMATAIALGTASTGTAISTLSGAAAVNAALAWLGGGTLAAGGWGVAGGMVVVSGGTLIAVAGVGYAVHLAFSYYDQVQERQRIELTIASLRARSEFSGGANQRQRFETVQIGAPAGH
jgi:hypothetical protein